MSHRRYATFYIAWMVALLFVAAAVLALAPTEPQASRSWSRTPATADDTRAASSWQMTRAGSGSYRSTKWR